MLIVGAAAKTFYFDASKNLSSNGPALATNRTGHGCGTIALSSLSTTQTVIVAGGQNALRQVEILDGAANTWHAGKVT
jgi:hypothetical protein